MGFVNDVKVELFLAGKHLCEFERKNKFSFSLSVLFTFSVILTFVAWYPELMGYLIDQFALMSQQQPVIAGALIVFLEICWFQAYLEVVLNRSWKSFALTMWLELTTFYLKNNPERNKLFMMVLTFSFYSWVGFRFGLDYVQFILLFCILRELKQI